MPQHLVITDDNRYEEWQQDAIFSVYFSTSNEVISGFLPVQYSTGEEKW